MKKFCGLRLFLLLSLLIIVTLSLFSESNAALSGKEPWADSLMSMTAAAEPNLQYLLDSLGYNINVATDELGLDVFCGIDGLNTATMVIEIAGSAVLATSGYYEAGNISPLYQIFGPSNVPGDSIQFTFTTFNSIGFYMKPNLSGSNDTWYTEIGFNSDSYDHFWTFPTGNPHEYIIAVEDLPDGGDEDYNDLVFKVRFHNFPPVFVVPETTVVQCSISPICFDILASDPNCQGDSIWLSMTSGEGTFAPDSGLEVINASHCFTPTISGDYEFDFLLEDITGETTTATAIVHVITSYPPVVNLDDTTVSLCNPAEICIPVSILDDDGDITSITTNIGSYSGTSLGFDQVSNINALGGSVTQIGGGDPGKTLYTASDFVGPVNSQSGVSVTLPNFVFINNVTNYGSFPNGTVDNSAVVLIGSPTDLTFTLPGAGGPDGTFGDGSVTFDNHDQVTLSFPQSITTNNGSNTDFVVFTNTDGNGTVRLYFRYGNSTVYTLNVPVSGGSSGSGLGGITLDLPDGITFNGLKVRCQNGTFEIDALAARTAPSPTATDLCFYADTSGIYEVIVTATDTCGSVGADTAYVTVNLNSAPVANAGNNISTFLCEYEEFCFNVNFSDFDNNIVLTEKTQGPGTLTGNQICFTPANNGPFTFVIHAVDACGLQDYDTVVVSFDNNDPPIADNPDSIFIFLCETTELCHTFTAADPNGGTLTWSKLSGAGTITAGGEFCFTPTIAGNYGAAVVVTDSCGAADTTTIQYVIDLNNTPFANNPGAAVNVFQCVASEICYQFTANDPDGGITWSKLSGDGTLSSAGLWCFTPAATGSYTVTAVVADSCGTADTVSHTYNVTLNDAPTIAFGADTTLLLCAEQEICVDYTPNDPQGLSSLTEEMISGFGIIDTANNDICFTPTSDGNYEFIVKITDSCGMVDEDTIVVSVTYGNYAAIDCPSDPINIFLCNADVVCQILDVTPSTAIVTPSFGTYTGGQLCFDADTSGTYLISIIAEDECSVDTCHLEFIVEIGSNASITCPNPKNFFLCEADTVCIPVGVNGTDVVVNVTPIGTFNAGSVCFPADTSGHYEIEVIAFTNCGSDTCLVIADIIINSTPIAVEPTTPVDTFICNASQICYQFSVNDPDGGTLNWARLSGNGTVSSSGLWCFNANSSGSFSVIAAVTDSCGAADTVSMTYNIIINSSPMIALGVDTTLFTCDIGIVCWPFDATDVDDNIVSIDIISGGASSYIDDVNDNLCFIPNSEGLYPFVVSITDACGNIDYDTIQFNIQENDAPLVNAGNDQTIFQCELAEICWNASVVDPDGNLTGYELVSGPGTFNGSQICFTPTGTWNYEFVLKGTDFCGLESYDTVAVYYTLNSAPLANAGVDQTLFICDPTEICWNASCSDVDNNLSTCSLIEGPGSYDGSQICFNASATGSYLFVLEAVDACGKIDLDSVTINITNNTAPICTVPNDTSIFQCTAAEVFLPVYGTDLDGNLQFCQIISGPGSLIGGNWYYTPVSDQAVNVTIRCQDSCGAYCQTDFTVEFNINAAPSIAFENDTSISLCDIEEICLPYIAFDPDDPRPTTISLISGSGSLDQDSSWVCFTPAATGLYTFVIRIEDECGKFDQDTINVNITVNTPPTANAGVDQTLFLCDSVTQICWTASCFDADGNLDNCYFNGPGSYDGSQICFTPPTTGSYLFTLRAVDECGEEMTDSVYINVTINSDPVAAFGADDTQMLCVSSELCYYYTANDDDGLAGITETMVSGFGSIDTLNNKVCFTPTTDGTYEFIVRVTDPCGAIGEDTIVANITFGDFAVIDCPVDPVDVYLCAPDEVCLNLGIAPVDATVSTSFGTYANGELCFNADTAGIYVITVIADAECGSDTCEITFNVDIGSAAQIACPDPQSFFICAPDSVCFPLTVILKSEPVEVYPFGSYSAGQVCFPADTSGHYELTIIATTACGSDTCVAEVDVIINTSPVAVDPPTNPIDTFMCANDQVCYQFSAADVDGGTLIWSRVSGPGTVTGGGLWCFSVTAAGSYTVVANVTDSCGAADQVTLTYNVTKNSPPIVDFGVNETYFQCDPVEICVDFVVNDLDDNINLVELIYGSGSIVDDTLVCFTPDTAGRYIFIVGATDECGAYDQDTIDIFIELNADPIVFAGNDQAFFLCEAMEICWEAYFTDPDNNVDTCYLTAGPGIFNGSHICFTPDTAGVYTFILRAEDECTSGRAIDEDTVLVTIDLNEPPICNLPNDTSLFQCGPTQVALPIGATDPDGNFDHCEIVTGPGSISNGFWTYTPSADITAKVKVMCLDSCGVMCLDSFTVSFNLNMPPVVDLGPNTNHFLCSAQNICWDIIASDEDGNLATVEILEPAGAYYNGSQLCYNFVTESVKKFVVKATDSCGAVTTDSTTISVDFNVPPVLELPPDFTAYLDVPGEVCFDVSSSDIDNNLSTITASPFGTYNSSADKICFNVDTSGIYCLEVTASDLCGAETVDTICLEMIIDECIHIQVEKTHGAIQGQPEIVHIYQQGSGKELGGFDFLIAYDAGALNPRIVTPGALFESCGWEYFTYRNAANGNCSGSCPTGLLRIVGLADMNNGAYHPGCYLNDQIGSLADIEFLVTSDRTFECMYIPIRFFWLDCNDNSVASRTGDTLWISRSVYDFELSEITDNSYGFPSSFGALDDCLVGGGPDKPAAIRCIDFTNGGVDIICADSIDDRGDINLNGVAYEIADAVVYTNYFIYGLSALDISVDGQTAASDVNADGISLSVGDLVYLIRVVVGDAMALPKLDPNLSDEVIFNLNNGILAISESDYRVGAIFLTIEGNVIPSLHSDADNMELRSNFDGTDTRVLIYNMSGKNFLELGNVLNVGLNNKIKEIEVGAYNGLALKGSIGELPDKFELLQNYPNPFNPITTIKFALPVASKWDMTIYNILGQQVDNFNGDSEAGFESIEWDAGRFASGVYFYRLKAGSFSATKKMVMVK